MSDAITTAGQGGVLARGGGRINRVIISGCLFAIATACVGVPQSSVAHAAEALLVTMRADIEGSGRSRVITLREGGDGDFHTYELRVDRALAGGRFFAADGDKPLLQIVDVDTRSDGKEILIKIPGPSDCGYILYGYRDGLLDVIGTLASDNCSYEPRLTSDGQIVMSSWAGFWEKREVYQLSRQTQRLELRQQRYYIVGVQAAAKQRLEGCLTPRCSQPFSVGPQGVTVEILLYDPIEMSYLLRTSENVTVWITEADLRRNLALPWAD